MKDRLERLRRIEAASGAIASSIEAELVRRDRARRRAAQDAQEMSSAISSPLLAGLAFHSNLLRRAAREAKAIMAADEEISTLRARLIGNRSRERASRSQAERLEAVLERQRQEAEVLELASTRLAPASGKRRVFD